MKKRERERERERKRKPAGKALRVKDVAEERWGKRLVDTWRQLLGEKPPSPGYSSESQPKFVLHRT